MTKQNQTVRGILLNDGFREAGSAEQDGRTFSWPAGYMVTVLPYGASRGSDIRKYRGAVGTEKQLEAMLATVEWGTLITLVLDDDLIVDITAA